LHKTKGVAEWADVSVNLFKGCYNDCLYCYAKNFAERGNWQSRDTWTTMIPNEKNIKKRHKKYNGRVMFPTSHDITDDPFVFSTCLETLDKLLNWGNEVLITTKPRFVVVKAICDNYLDKPELKKLIQFRFTITSIIDTKLEFWEKNTPKYRERLESLEYAFNKGYKTSVSIEPMLDFHIIGLINDIYPYITESIWLGIMNYVSKELINDNDRYSEIIMINSTDHLKNLYFLLRDIPKIRFKDSIINKLKKEGVL